MVRYYLDLYNVHFFICSSHKELRKVSMQEGCPYLILKDSYGLGGMCNSFVANEKKKIVIWARDVISLTHEIIHAKNAIYDWIGSPVSVDYDEPEAWLVAHLMDACLSAYNNALPLRYAKA